MLLGFGQYEATEIGAIIAAAEAGSTVIDIGANVGFYSVVVARARPDVSLVAVEPVSDNLQRLRAHLFYNAISNVDVVAAAVSEEEGAGRMTLDPDGALARLGAEEHAGQPVPVTTLDAIWRSLGSPVVSVIKLDVEGMEDRVLAGGGALLKGCRPAILAEVLDEAARDRLDSTLAPVGYQAARLRGFEPRSVWYEATTVRGCDDGHGPSAC